jgi:4'-phosphopantetheinyl transferase EntD
VIGSITHKGTYRAAAVARAGPLAGLGIDAELDAPLPRGVLESIALESELEELERLAATDIAVCWDRLLFSTKEAAVKAAQPLGLGRPDLRSTEIALDERAASFTAALALPSGRLGPEVSGRWLARGGLLIAVAGALRPAV